jgi:hypothetical protein
LVGKTPLNGYLDRLRTNISALDESIKDTRKAPKMEKPADKRARLKLLRDLVELQNSSLLAVKSHLLGKSETGASIEPPDYWDSNDQIEFERYFKNQLSPWTEDDLMLECKNCGLKSEEVSNHIFTHPYPRNTEYFNLCEKCHDKRTNESTVESKKTDGIPEPASKHDISVILQTAALQLKILRTFPVEQRITKLEELVADKLEVAPGMEPAWEAYRGVLQKELDKAKAARDHAAQPSKG